MSDDVRDLIAELAQQESAAAASPFLAPCVPGATVRTRVAGLVRSFSPRPENFEGWGVFRARRGDVSDRVARLEREADLPEVDRYLAALPRMGLWLIHVLRGRTWLALPMNGSDAKQRFGREGPVAVRLVDDGSPMDRIEAAFDGAAWWFAGEDRRADPFLSQQLRDSSALSTELDVPGLTPELRDAYRIAYDPLPLPLIEEPAPARRVTEPSHGEPELDRIRRALLDAGGELRDARDRGDFWWVQWATGDGDVHHSAIAKHDLTVLSAGICLDDMDSDFDLQSLVGVVEGAW